GYIGRAPSAAGVDQIAFQVPQGVQGCYVPVAVIVNNMTSNTTTMSITPGGGPCGEPSVGLSNADLQQMISNESARVGTVTLTSIKATIAGGGQVQQVQNDTGSANFSNMTPDQFIGTPGGFPSPGGCTVASISGTGPSQPNVGLPLDAGPSVNVNGPGGSQLLTQSNGAYTATFAAGYLQSGGYESDSGGGADVGPFQATLNTPAPFTWTNAP